MHLKRIKLIDFKNYTEANVAFSERINCFIGNNGVGKTNLLDGIYYLSFCKSYFNSIDNQNIRFNQPFFAIHGNYQRNGLGNDSVSCIQKKQKKKIFKRNDKDYKRLYNHIGEFPLVMISPYDRDLINEGSALRRKFIDGVISQFNRNYLEDLLNYNKAIQHRNQLLKKYNETRNYNYELFEIWDKQIIYLGEKLYGERKKYLSDFLPLFQEYYQFIGNANEKVNIQYQSTISENGFQNLLKENFEKDKRLQYTSVGVHKDDFILTINNHIIKKFGSQGQQKSFVLSMKLAQFDYIKERKGMKPLLLLDDIFDKLDKDRVGRLVKLVSENHFGQVFITDTQHERVEKIFKENNIEHKIFMIEDGNIKEITSK